MAKHGCKVQGYPIELLDSLNVDLHGNFTRESPTLPHFDLISSWLLSSRTSTNPLEIASFLYQIITSIPCKKNDDGAGIDGLLAPLNYKRFSARENQPREFITSLQNYFHGKTPKYDIGPISAVRRKMPQPDARKWYTLRLRIIN